MNSGSSPKIIKSSSEQHSLVSAESKILQHEVRIANSQVLRIYLRNHFLRKRLGGNDETVHREHDAAQFAIEFVVGVARKNNEVGGYSPLLCDNSWPAAFFYIKNMGLFVNRCSK